LSFDQERVLQLLEERERNNKEWGKVKKMNNPGRAFSFAKIESEGDLMEAMFNHKWPLCYSFYHNRLFYLSDGESEDMPEYAIVTAEKTEGRFVIHGRELGRINPKSMSTADALKFIQGLNASNYATKEKKDLFQFMAEPKWHHNCVFCGL
jgi:hypothetical protein